MLPFLIAGAALLLVGGAVLEERESSAKRRSTQKLTKQKKSYEQMLHRQYHKSQKSKSHILFRQIKNEQTKLKAERRKLYGILNSLKRGSQPYRNLEEKIGYLSQLIEGKQRDADRVRQV